MNTTLAERPAVLSTGTVLIPGGEFWIGSNDGADAEQPRHIEMIKEFRMDATPVTNAMFRFFVEDTGYVTEAERTGAAWGYNRNEYMLVPNLSWRRFADADRDDHPVVLVSWHDAVTYATWARKRLPTEIEWEAAARGGLDGSLYPWGDADPTGRCNWRQQATEVPPTSSVHTYAANGYGLYDMVGNVWQWCADDFRPCYGATAVSPPGLKARRGGAWNVIQAFRLRCANRGAMDASMAAPNVGFRCASS